MEDNSPKTAKKSSKLSWSVWLVLLVVLASLGTAGYFWNEARDANSKTNEAVQARNLEETDQVVGDLGGVFLIDSEDSPTVARIEDPAILQKSNPEFYKNAEVGDYLVLYPQRAIIFRSENKQIINVAPIINTDQLKQQADEQATQEPTENSTQN